MNILIPMAGAGKRFMDAGYVMPKPLIPIEVYDGIGYDTKPMIELVVDNITNSIHDDHTRIFIMQQSHWQLYKHDLAYALHEEIPTVQTFVLVDGVTEGAACTTLLAEMYIDNDEPLFLANSDQFVKDWDYNDFMRFINYHKPDGCVVTFEATHPKWSYAAVNEHGYITEVAEKNPISHRATVGFYYWAHGSDYVKYAKQMIAKNIRTNNEFYVCPVFNEAIHDGKRIMEYQITDMYGLGTPEDLKSFIETI